MKFQVHMFGSGGDGKIRPVDVPDREIIGLVIRKGGGDLESLLGLVFYHGQGAFQSFQHSSVRIGDVIELDGHGFYLIQSCGFSRLAPDVFQRYRSTPRRDLVGSWGEGIY